MNSVLHRHRRPGVALIMAMVCLALAAILMSLILQTVMMRRGVARACR